MLLTIGVGFRISTEHIEFVTVANFRIRHSLSEFQASRTSNVVVNRHFLLNRHFFLNSALFCGEVISLSVVNETVKACSHPELRLSSGGGAMSERLHPSSRIYPRALPARRQGLVELQHRLSLKRRISWLLCPSFFWLSSPTSSWPPW